MYLINHLNGLIEPRSPHATDPPIAKPFIIHCSAAPHTQAAAAADHSAHLCQLGERTSLHFRTSSIGLDTLFSLTRKCIINSIINIIMY